MPQLPQADLWSTFSPQTQRHLCNVWTELLGRYLQAQRGLPRGTSDEPHDAHPAAARRENSARVREAIHYQASPTQPGEPATPIPVGRDGHTAGLAASANL